MSRQHQMSKAFKKSLCAFFVLVSLMLPACNMLEMSPGTGASATDDLRIVQGSLIGTPVSSTNANANANASIKYTQKSLAVSQTCSANKMSAINQSGKKIGTDILEDCSFAMELPTNDSYVFNLSNSDAFVASVSFGQTSSFLLPLTDAIENLDLGAIVINGTEANCVDEKKPLCGIDIDKNGTPLCEDENELNNNFFNTTQPLAEDSADDNSSDDASCNDANKTWLCHIPSGNPANAHSICVDTSAATYINHLKHGDTLGQCTLQDNNSDDDTADDDENNDADSDDAVDDDEDSNAGGGENIECVPNTYTAVKARFDFEMTKNWVNGTLTQNVYLGTSSSPTANGEWFKLRNKWGKKILDGSVNKDVAGLAIQRGDGWMHVTLYGHYATGLGKEALIGTLSLEGAKITHIVNDVEQGMEQQGDGLWIFGNAGQDEYEVADDQTLSVVSTVTTSSDAFTVYYDFNETATVNCEENNQEEDAAAEPEECIKDVSIRFTTDRLQNWGAGNVTSRLYVGADDANICVPDDAWTDLTNNDGKIIIDSDVSADVPGISIQRGHGWLLFTLWAYHTGTSGSEAILGTLEFDGASIKRVLPDPSGPLELAQDGLWPFGTAANDEYVILNEHQIRIQAGESTHKDALYIVYEPDKCDAE
ncbi:MAG: hypothetical protein HQM16_04225 [Deltaproteobacteria bacterium]|nr:hypothetical protein [Deltaproteobacteria bacterium]